MADVAGQGAGRRDDRDRGKAHEQDEAESEAAFPDWIEAQAARRGRMSAVRVTGPETKGLHQAICPAAVTKVRSSKTVAIQKGSRRVSPGRFNEAPQVR